MTYETKSACAIAGLAALTEMLALIGKDGKTDHDLAKIFTENELNIRNLMEAYVDRLVVGSPL